MIQPLYDKIVLDPIKDEQITSSGFIIAGDREKPQEAIVVAVGTGVQHRMVYTLRSHLR